MMGKGGAQESASGSQRDYLDGLNHLRTLVTEVELDIDRAQREFYKAETSDADEFEKHLKLLNEKLLYCNNKLRKNQKKLEVIDGEIKLVELLNRMRQLAERDNIDPAVISFLTEFWESGKSSMDSLKIVSSKFKSGVFKRLRTSCRSYREANASVDFTLATEYNQQVSKMEEEITSVLEAIERIIKMYEQGVDQSLFTNTSFSDRILVSCDRKAFPILRVFPDLSEKLARLCSVATQWIDKDETYVRDIYNHIRATRTQARQKESDLRTQREKQGELRTSVDEAFKLFTTNKDKLSRIEGELRVLEEQMVQYDNAKKYKTEEKKTKEGIIGFLDISISQTKKNFTLQLKRSRLMRQLRELEESLRMIEDELTSMRDERRAKSDKRTIVEARFQQSSESYETLKSDLDDFSKRIERLGKEVDELTDSITHLEIIQSFKTCPEKVEDLFDKPAAVKLAPSLKEKIQLRKRKLHALNKR